MLLKPRFIMSLLFRDIEEDSTIEVDVYVNDLIEGVIRNEVYIQINQYGNDSYIYLDIHTAIQFRKALTLAIGKAKNETK